MFKRTGRGLWIGLALGLTGITGCTTATPYQPYVGEGARGVHGGYSQERLGPDSFRVRFHGNELTSRERVEAYLLYRTAELTLQQGFDWFNTIASHTEHEIRTYASPDPFYRPYWDYPYWRPYWGYYRRGYGWDYWDPWRSGPFWSGRVDIRTVEAFEASAEVRMHKGATPVGEPGAMDARQVMARLGPSIELPKTR